MQSKSRKSKCDELWNAIRINRGSHHKTLIDKTKYHQTMNELQDKINKAKGNMFSYWTTKKIEAQKKQQQQQQGTTLSYDDLTHFVHH